MAKKPMIQIAGELREMTDEEYAVYLQDQENGKKIEAEKIEAENKKATLLDKLGITAEEAKLLLS